MSEDSFSSESLLLSSEKGGVSEEDEMAAVALESIADDASVTSVLPPHEYPESGVLFCQNWSGQAHPVGPCRPLFADDPQRRSHVRFTFRDYKVVIIEKFIDNSFEYSFAYEYWPTGGIRCVVSTRARLGVLVEEFDEV
jgi:hypothetical protein